MYKLQMQSYKLRTDDITDSLVKDLSHDASSLLYCRERGTNDLNLHYHWFIRTDVQNATLRARIRKHGLKGNGSYSLKKLEEDYPIEYIAYVLKEGDYVSVKGITEELLSQAKEYDQKVKNDIKATKEAKKKTIDKLKDYIKETMSQEEYEASLFTDSYPTRSRVTHVTYKLIMSHVIQFHISNGLLIRRSMVTTYTDTLMTMYPGGQEYLIQNYCS